MRGTNVLRFKERMEKIRHLIHGVAEALRPCGIAVARQVERDDAVALRKLRKHAPPCIQRLADAVNEQQRLAHARFQVMNADLFFPACPVQRRHDCYIISDLLGIDKQTAYH